MTAPSFALQHAFASAVHVPLHWNQFQRAWSTALRLLALDCRQATYTDYASIMTKLFPGIDFKHVPPGTRHHHCRRSR